MSAITSQLPLPPTTAYLSPGLVGGQHGELVIDLICHIVHEPAETLAVVLLLELELLGHVTDGVSAHAGLARVKVLLEIVVQPHLHHTHVVLVEL